MLLPSIKQIICLVLGQINSKINMMVQSKVLLLGLIFFTYLYGHSSTASSPSLPASAGLNDEIRRYQLNNLGRVLLDEAVDSHHKNNFFDIWYERPHS